jgi:hypothetical protein
MLLALAAACGGDDDGGDGGNGPQPTSEDGDTTPADGDGDDDDDDGGGGSCGLVSADTVGDALGEDVIETSREDAFCTFSSLATLNTVGISTVDLGEGARELFEGAIDTLNAEEIDGPAELNYWIADVNQLTMLDGDTQIAVTIVLQQGNLDPQQVALEIAEAVVD